MIFILLLMLLFPVNLYANTRDGLVGWWKLDEESGTSFADSSWNNLTATGANTTILKNCKRGNCLSFNGTNSTLTTTNTLASTGDFTFAAWIFYKGNSATSTYAGVIVLNASPTRLLYIEDSTFAIKFFNDVSSVISSGRSPTLNVWTHLVATLSGTTFTFYLDGVSVYSGTHTVSGVTDVVGIGGYSSGYGNLDADDVRIYNRALTLQEIKDLYNSGIRLNYAPGT